MGNKENQKSDEFAERHADEKFRKAERLWQKENM